MELRVEWLGRIAYREAWHRQHELVAARAAGEIPDTLLVLEHDAVLTLGRQSDPAHIRATDAELAARGIEVVRVERGGEVTYHGPGQLVAYPIVRLADSGLLLRPFVRALEAAMSDTAATYGIAATRRDGYPGCWVDPEGIDGPARKLGALGLRIERGVSYHGIAFNVTTRLEDFELIDPCGLTDIEVTSVARELGWSGAQAEPSTVSVEKAADSFAAAFRARLRGGRLRQPGGAGRPQRGVGHMPGGLFELRRDDITGWWVAVVVDREYDRSRFALPAGQVGGPDHVCQNCRHAPNDGVWMRTLKPQAFTIAGGERDLPDPLTGRTRAREGRSGESRGR